MSSERIELKPDDVYHVLFQLLWDMGCKTFNISDDNLQRCLIEASGKELQPLMAHLYSIDHESPHIGELEIPMDFYPVDTRFETFDSWMYREANIMFHGSCSFGVHVDTLTLQRRPSLTWGVEESKDRDWFLGAMLPFVWEFARQNGCKDI